MLLSSPAKINLFFRVIGKRDDGYHEIESLYQAIDLCDQLTIEHAEEERDSLSSSNSELPCDETNLILQAAHLFKKKTGISKHFHFDLKKVIPIQAGLGGGSSNAATTFWGLSRFMDLKIDDETLAKKIAIRLRLEGFQVQVCPLFL